MDIVTLVDIHFYGEDRVTILLENRSPDNKRKFSEILSFCLFVLRTMQNMGQNKVGYQIAQILASIKKENIKHFACSVNISKPTLIDYPQYKGNKRFETTLLFNSTPNYQYKPIGFGILGKGLGYYASNACLSFLEYLVTERAEDEDFLDKLSIACYLCGETFLDGKVSFDNQFALSLSFLLLLFPNIENEDEQINEEDNEFGENLNDLIYETSKIFEIVGNKFPQSDFLHDYFLKMRYPSICFCNNLIKNSHYFNNNLERVNKEVMENIMKFICSNYFVMFVSRKQNMHLLLTLNLNEDIILNYMYKHFKFNDKYIHFTQNLYEKYNSSIENENGFMYAKFIYNFFYTNILSVLDESKSIDDIYLFRQSIHDSYLSFIESFQIQKL